MSIAINSALSGLNAASTQLQVAANNIANMGSTETQQANGSVTISPYQPQEVVQVSLSGGGVAAKVVPATGQPQQVYQPSSPDADAQGLVSYPNEDPAGQLVQTQLATYDFKANLKTMSAQNDMFQNLLNMIS